jgi:hypothetical protein
MNAVDRLGNTQAEFWHLAVDVRDRPLTEDERAEIARLARELRDREAFRALDKASGRLGQVSTCGNWRSSGSTRPSDAD